jgi:hypothetical protein
VGSDVSARINIEQSSRSISAYGAIVRSGEIRSQLSKFTTYIMSLQQPTQICWHELLRVPGLAISRSDPEFTDMCAQTSRRRV